MKHVLPSTGAGFDSRGLLCALGRMVHPRRTIWRHGLISVALDVDVNVRTEPQLAVWAAFGAPPSEARGAYLGRDGVVPPVGSSSLRHLPRGRH